MNNFIVSGLGLLLLFIHHDQAHLLNFQPYKCLTNFMSMTLHSSTAYAAADYCQPEEACMVQVWQYDNRYRFYGGCINQNYCRNGKLLLEDPYQVCGKCCYGYECNKDLCKGSAVTAVTPGVQTTIVNHCATCNRAKSLSECTVKQCQRGEECFMSVTENVHGVQLFGGCTEPSFCNNFMTYYGVFGRHLCGKCCDGPGCYKDLCTENQHVYGSYPCLSCSSDSLHDCTKVDMCDKHQVCAVRAVKYGQSVKLHGYCVGENQCKNDILVSSNPHGGTEVCAKCCHGNMCNKNLCETSASAVHTTSIVTTASAKSTHPTSSSTTTTKPTTSSSTTTSSIAVVTTPIAINQLSSCLYCYNVSSLNDCTDTDLCHHTETCSMKVVETSSGEIKYFGGCAPNYRCRNEQLTTDGGSAGRKLCGKCCTGKNCNRHACLHWYTPSALASASTTTSSSTSTTTALKTSTYSTTPEPTTVRTTTPVVSSNSQSATHTVTAKQKYNCLSCYNVSSVADCTDTEPCHFSQMCSLKVTSRNGQTLLSGGCVPDYACTVNHKLLFEDDKLCGECCNDDYCNRNLCKEYMTATKELQTSTTKSTNFPTTMTTTTTTTTTTIPTTTPSRTTTTATTTTTLKSADCEVCDGGLCGLIPGNDPVQACPASKPYCMNVVKNSASGQKTYSKRCSNARDCQVDWWQLSSDQATCTDFKPTTPYFFQFTCTYCCTTTRCNKDIFPAANTLFQGKN